jgi:hypothetical protein
MASGCAAACEPVGDVLDLVVGHAKSKGGSPLVLARSRLHLWRAGHARLRLEAVGEPAELQRRGGRVLGGGGEQHVVQVRLLRQAHHQRTLGARERQRALQGRRRGAVGGGGDPRRGARLRNERALPVRRRPRTAELVVERDRVARAARGTRRGRAKRQLRAARAAGRRGQRCSRLLMRAIWRWHRVLMGAVERLDRDLRGRSNAAARLLEQVRAARRGGLAGLPRQPAASRRGGLWHFVCRPDVKIGPLPLSDDHATLTRVRLDIRTL